MLPSMVSPGIGLLAYTCFVAAFTKRIDLAPEPIDMSPPSRQFLAMAERFHAEDGRTDGAIFERDATIYVDLHMYVVTGTQGGQEAIKDETLDRQLNLLNEAYRTAGFSFQKRSITRIVEPEFVRLQDFPVLTPSSGPAEIMSAILAFASGNLAGRLVRQAHRQGNMSTLNLYILENLNIAGTDFEGFATLPDYTDFGPDPSSTRQLHAPDGVVLNAREIAREEESAQRIPGALAAHEVGHWLGLLHTFHGGCDGPGDWIDDTPAEKEAHMNCSPRDSCPDQPGSDAVSNMMSYSYMGCQDEEKKFEFTAGQIRRMRRMWTAFRGTDNAR